MSNYFAHFKSYTLSGLLQYLWMKLRKKSILVGGSCHICGTCCRRLSLEGKNGWLRSLKEFEETVKEYPEYSRFEMVCRDKNGYLVFNCIFCTPEGGCSDYENRLDLCKNFPEKSLHFCGGSLPEKCGYYFMFVKPFDTVLSEEMKKNKCK